MNLKIGNVVMYLLNNIFIIIVLFIIGFNILFILYELKRQMNDDNYWMAYRLNIINVLLIITFLILYNGYK